MSERLIPVADVVTTHGLDGWLKLNPFNPDTTLVSSLEKLYLEKNGIASEHKVESIKPHKGQLLAKLGGVDSIEQAEKWVGSVACVAEANLPTLNSGEYYHYQTIGLEVFDLIFGLVVPVIGLTGVAFNILSRHRIELIRQELDLQGGWKPGR